MKAGRYRIVWQAGRMRSFFDWRWRLVCAGPARLRQCGPFSL